MEADIYCRMREVAQGAIPLAAVTNLYRKELPSQESIGKVMGLPTAQQIQIHARGTQN